MWVDMFPLNENRKETPFKVVDVNIRKPKKFQLRVVIFNTKDVILDDVNMLTGERSSDIYMKGFLCDQFTEYQKSDIHYRSLDGEGNFNWRFIFDFEYLPAEQMIVYTYKGKLGFHTIERKRKPEITVQCYDADQLSRDDHLGEIVLNLSQLLKGANSPDSCTLKMLKDNKWPKVNLFKIRNHRGWWPFQALNSNQNYKLTV